MMYWDSLNHITELLLTKVRVSMGTLTWEMDDTHDNLHMEIGIDLTQLSEFITTMLNILHIPSQAC